MIEMKKFIIPTCLSAVIAISAIFALAPIDNATTVHIESIANITTDLSGASLILTPDQLSTTFTVADDISHYTWIESDDPFTIKELEIKAAIGDGDGPAGDNDDQIRFHNVFIIPEQYAKTLAGAQDAFTDRANGAQIVNEVCDACNQHLPEMWHRCAPADEEEADVFAIAEAVRQLDEDVHALSDAHVADIDENLSPSEHAVREPYAGADIGRRPEPVLQHLEAPVRRRRPLGQIGQIR